MVFCIELCGQALEPRAYAVAPVGANAVLFSYGHAAGELNFAPAVPITDGEANINTAAAGYFQAIDFFGRSGSIAVVQPYTFGDVSGFLDGEFAAVTRSGLADPSVRIAVNLIGAPAMDLKEFAQYKQKGIIGVSFKAVPPLGQYDPAKLINLGTNRWSFKPELGLTRAIKKWTLEAYIGGWFFTENTNFFGGSRREQDPIFTTQYHVVYNTTKRSWVGFNANFYVGGRTTLDGTENLDLQRNSRVGVTVALPVAKKQSLKVAYSVGAFTTVGADFQQVSVAYQYIFRAGKR